jgi:hypothetical protein
VTNRLEDEDRFDRLADGELSNEQYRTLLASLDDEPGGWRQCAIALLEKQALEKELGEVAAEAQTPTLESRAAAIPPPPPRSPLRGLYAMAVAAGLVAAFGLGALYHSLGDRNGPVAKDQRQENKANVRENQLADGMEQKHEQLIDRLPSIGDDSRNEVTLVVSDPLRGVEQQVNVPLLDPKQVDREWFTTSDQPLPEVVRRTLLLRGHDVQLRQELVPVQLPDGRTLIVPVQQYDVMPVDAGPFQ